VRQGPALVAEGTDSRFARGRLVMLTTAGVGLSVVTAAITLRGFGHTGPAAAGRVLLVILPLAVGGYAASRPSSARCARVLIVASLGSFLATLAEARAPLLYSLGRVSP
jgi:hypothetical protein